MGRKPCCEKEGLNRGAWSALEDKALTKYIDAHGEGKWRDLPQRAGLNRCGKSCRLRWLNYLRPDIKRGNISGEEEELIVKLHKLLGNRWSLIAGRLPGRTDNEIKNYWNTNLSKRSSDQASDNKAPQDQDQPSSTNSKDNTNKSKSSNQVQVIRTKAFKCKKNVAIPSHLDGHDQTVNKSPKLDVPAANSEYSESPCSSGDRLLLDFNVNDVFISDILNSSDFQQAQVNECDLEMVDYGITKVEDLLMGEARVGNCDHDFKSNGDHHGGDIDLNALSSFLNSVDDDDEWLVI